MTIIIVLLSITLVILGVCGEHQTKYVWYSQSNHTGDTTINATDNLMSNSDDILSELLLGIYLLSSWAILPCLSIGILVVITLFLEANSSKLKVIVKQILAVPHFGFSQSWERQENESTIKNSSLSYLIQVIYNNIDEEGQGYLTDLQSEWINSNLSQAQIKAKKLKFLADHYRGRLIEWMRLPRFSIFTRIR